jgi:two-component system phosphate regulon sensor histidine kinase PhoR
MAVSLVVSKKISTPIEEMKQGAERFAGGELKTRLLVPDSEELGGLAETMNEMAAQLDARIQTITRQRNEREAILASMAEGLIAVDSQEKIISINRAACEMFGLRTPDIQGTSIQEAVRNAALHSLVAGTLQGYSGSEQEREVILDIGGKRFLQAHGAVLRDATGERIGAVIVINDITRLRQLENVRRDFVANVSHELRTPITSIKGFVETLLEGALDSPDDAKRFLGIIAKQVDHMNEIIGDLLLLSRIEQDYEPGTEKPGMTLERGRIRELLESCIEVCAVKATGKDISIGLSCEKGLVAEVNRPLLEQAVVNLIDNAIQYSERGGMVQVEALKQEDEVAIMVRDQGCGIPEEYLPRLFERFFRVDKARSRKHGGTGLGLAIVKHITQAHRGRLSVDSSPGQGSTFSIYLPAS